MGLKAQVAAELRELGRLAEAEELCRQALAIEPDHIGSLAELGHIAAARRSPRRCCCLSGCDHTTPISHRIETAGGFGSSGVNRLEEAERYASERLPRATTCGSVCRAGQIARHRGDREKSLASYEAAAAAAPRHVQYKLDAVADLRELGRLDEAETVLREVLEVEPQHAGALIWLGQIARHRGDRGAAVAAFAAVLLASPNDARVTVEAANGLREIGHMEAADWRYSGS